jgi:hypothetical protein
MAATTALAPPRFVRRTRLGANEYRRNFHQIDHDVLAAVTSAEADCVTPLMSKIYLRLVSAPTEFWEREGVLYFSAGEEAGRPVKASKMLYGALGVASATAHKALGWMHEQGIIGYFAGKNGTGIRIFLNRAAGSIGVRTAASGEKILPFARGSHEGDAGSSDEPAFNDSYAVSELLDKCLNPRAPKNGAEITWVAKTSFALTRPPALVTPTLHVRKESEQSSTQPVADAVPVEEIVDRLKSALEPRMKEAAAQAAAQSVSREMERTREWFETKALPKAVRVAQHETYDLLRKHGPVETRRGQGSASLEVGRAAEDYTLVGALPLTPEEVRETAEVCVALLEAQDKPLEVTLSEISLEGGGWLSSQDAPKVREAAQTLLRERAERG